MNDRVETFAIYNSDLYAGGKFTTAGSGSANHVARLTIAASVEDAETVHDVNIFPNPTTNELTIDNGELKIEQIEIYNVLGEKRLTLSRVLGAQRGEGLRIDVSSLAPGIYFVKLHGENQERVAKFVKQ